MRLKLVVCGMSLCAAALFSGCASFFGTARSAAPLNIDQEADPSATVDITLKNKYGKLTQKTLPMTPGMGVQDALKQTAAIRKFKDMEIKVYRVTPLSKGQPVPLQAKYDPAKNRVPELNDMALHPGDKILVEEVNVSQVELIVAKFTGNAPRRRNWDKD